MAGTVTTQTTRVTAAEAADSANWGDTGAGQGSGQNTDVVIQGLDSRSRRIDNANKGMAYDAGSGTEIDISARNTHVGIWVQTFQPSLLQSGGIQVTLGSATNPLTSPWSGYNGVSSTTYPASGGWVRVWVDPRRLRDAGAGTLDLTAVRWFGAEFNMGNVAGGVQNCLIDAIDYTTGGLLVDSGTAMSPAVFNDFLSADEGNTSNQYGIVLSRDGVIFCNAQLTIGDATATVFDDSGAVIVFGDQALVAEDFMGIVIDLQNSSSNFALASSIIRSGGTIRGHLRKFDGGVDGTHIASFDAVTMDNLRRITMDGDGLELSQVRIVNSGQADLVNGDWGGFNDFGGAGHLETQENVDLSSTSGDFEIIALIKPDDTTPTGNQTIVAQYGGTAATTGIRYYINTSGSAVLVIGNGTAATTLTGGSISSVTAIDGQDWVWTRWRYDSSLGVATFHYSLDPPDTPATDVTWTANGTPAGVARTLSNQARPLTIGAENDGTPAQYFLGEIKFVEVRTDGFDDTGASAGSIVSRFDPRTGPDFAGSPATRADDFDRTGLTWEEKGTTAPAMTLGSHITVGPTVNGTVIFDGSDSTAAMLWNVDDSSMGDFEFVSSGTGHAIELSPRAATTLALNSVLFSGYAVSDGTTGNEAIYNNSGKAITLNINNGDTPTIRNGSGSTTTVVNTVTISVTARFDGSPREGIRVRIEETDGTLIANGTTNASGVFSSSFAYSTDTTVKIIARLKGFKNYEAQDTITSNGLAHSATLQADPTVRLP